MAPVVIFPLLTKFEQERANVATNLREAFKSILTGTPIYG